MSANKEIFDSMLRHAMGVRRLGAQEGGKMLAILDESTLELKRMLSDRLVQGDFTSRRYQALLKDIASLRSTVVLKMNKSLSPMLSELAQSEQIYAKSLLENTVPVQLDYATVSAEKLDALIHTTPFAGGAAAPKTLNQWWSSVAAADQQRILGAVNTGMVLGETVPQMTKRIVDATGMTRANAEAVTRTAVNHVSNETRDKFFEANSSVIKFMRWVATLDGRTSLICMSRDGHNAPVSGTSYEGVPEPHLTPPEASPPAHPNCRSLRVAILDAEGIAEQLGDRAYVTDKRTGKQREKDFLAETKAKTENWADMTKEQRRAAVKQTKLEWTKKNVGMVPGTTTYEEWLRTQSKEFQDDVLGQAKAQEFRDGATLQDFVDRGPVNKPPPEPVNELQAKDTRPVQGQLDSPQVQQWRETLNYNEKSSIDEFTGNSDRCRNLRAVDAGTEPERWRTEARRLSMTYDDYVAELTARRDDLYSAMNKCPARYQGDIYRGFSLINKDALLAEYKAMEVGDVLSFDALSSTSRVEKTAHDFMYVHGANPDQTVLLRIKAKYNAYDISPLSALRGEAEVWVPKDTQFRVLKKEILPNGETVIDLEEITL